MEKKYIFDLDFPTNLFITAFYDEYYIPGKKLPSNKEMIDKIHQSLYFVSDKEYVDALIERYRQHYSIRTFKEKYKIDLTERSIRRIEADIIKKMKIALNLYTSNFEFAVRFSNKLNTKQLKALSKYFYGNKDMPIIKYEQIMELHNMSINSINNIIGIGSKSIDDLINIFNSESMFPKFQRILLKEV